MLYDSEVRLVDWKGSQHFHKARALEAAASDFEDRRILVRGGMTVSVFQVGSRIQGRLPPLWVFRV